MKMYTYTKKNITPILLGVLAGAAGTYLFASWGNVKEILAQVTARAVSHLKGHGQKRKKKKKDVSDGVGDIEGNSCVASSGSIPGECPGMDSKQAGKSEVCAGCPNRKICSDPKLKKEKEIEKEKIFNEVEENLKNVKFKILILSGKGGVGKSTIASQLAFTLSYLGYEVGLLDIDICGPSIPILTKTVNHDVNYSMNGWVPIYKNNLSIMSVGYLLPNFDDPVIWRGPKKNGLIKQFLCDVYWKNLDFLIIDTPPGTSDEHLTICSYLKYNLDGCLIVTTPHILSICDVKKEIEFCKKTNIPILGIIENMHQSIFISNYTVEKMCTEMSVNYAGKVTFNQTLIDACTEGVGCCDLDCNSISSKEIFNLCKFFIHQIYEKYTKIGHSSRCSYSFESNPLINNSYSGGEPLEGTNQEKNEHNQGELIGADIQNDLGSPNAYSSNVEMLSKLLSKIDLIIHGGEK